MFSTVSRGVVASVVVFSDVGPTREGVSDVVDFLFSSVVTFLSGVVDRDEIPDSVASTSLCIMVLVFDSVVVSVIFSGFGTDTSDFTTVTVGVLWSTDSVPSIWFLVDG